MILFFTSWEAPAMIPFRCHTLANWALLHSRVRFARAPVDEPADLDRADRDRRHCEKRTDEAIQGNVGRPAFFWIPSLTLAMTGLSQLKSSCAKAERRSREPGRRRDEPWRKRCISPLVARILEARHDLFLEKLRTGRGKIGEGEACRRAASHHFP
jgi:hypothetical protein